MEGILISKQRRLELDLILDMPKSKALDYSLQDKTKEYLESMDSDTRLSACRQEFPKENCLHFIDTVIFDDYI